jgi:hypothetical protein
MVTVILRVGQPTLQEGRQKATAEIAGVSSGDARSAAVFQNACVSKPNSSGLVQKS